MEIVPLPHLAKMFTSAQFAEFTPDSTPTDETSYIPSLITQTLDMLESDQEFLSVEGIFRIEGLESEKPIVQKLWQTGEPLSSWPTCYHSVPNLTYSLKQFLRACPPVLPYDMFDLFFAASERSNTCDQLYSLGQRTRQLPPQNFAIFRRLYRHGLIVLGHEPRNRMGLTGMYLFNPTK